MLLLLLGCQPIDKPSDSDAVPDSMTCTASVNAEIQTVIDLDWEAPVGSVSQVVFGTNDDNRITTNSVTDSTVHFPLVGFPSDQTVQWLATSETPNGEVLRCHGETKTGNVPADFPQPTLRVPASSAASSERYYIGTWFNDKYSRGFLVIFNRDAEVVWYKADEEGFTSMDVQPALDGVGLLYNHLAADFHEDKGSLRRISLDGTVLEEVTTPGAHHMFEQLPDGTLAYLQLDIRPYPNPNNGKLEDYVGDAIAEIQFGGEAKAVFSTWDWLTPVWNTNGSTLYNGIDWTHGNAIQYQDGNYLMSLGGLAELLEFRREDGELLRTLASTPMVNFHHQHDSNWLANGHLLMSITRENGKSGAAEYEVNGETLTEVWSSGFDMSTMYLGQARRLENGNTMINFGNAGVLREVDPDGETVWEVKAPDDLGMAQGTMVERLYGTLN